MTWFPSKTLNDYSQQIVLSFSQLSRMLNLDIKESKTSFSGPCPIHKHSDNPTAFLMYKNTGVWMCQTHGCHKFFKKTPLGLLQGILSVHNYNWDQFNERKMSIDECIKFLDEMKGELPTLPRYEPVYQKVEKELLDILPEDFAQHIQYPSDYFIKRGFEPIVLYNYLVGTYNGPIKPLKGREAVPIFNEDRTRIVGITARLPYQKCLVCSGFHDYKAKCPDISFDPSPMQKWKHNKGFDKSNLLYNWWSAKKYVQDTGKIIIVEGPLDVLKLEGAGIHNSVAIFGSDITYNQARMIMDMKPKVISTIMDSDEGGEGAEISCKMQFRNMNFNGRMQHFIPPVNDLGDMTSEDILNFLKKK